MPTLIKYKRGFGAYVRASIGGKFVTFQITIKGAERLKKYGIYPNQNFATYLLLRLYKTGDAFTHRGTIDCMEGGQEELNFKESQEFDLILPKCEIYGFFDDLYLVVKESESFQTARILGAKARTEESGKVILSVPLWILTKSVVSRLHESGLIPTGCPAFLKLQEWFDNDLDARWSSVQIKGVQKGLSLELEGELGLLGKAAIRVS